MNGRSEFKVKINRQAIAEIADKALARPDVLAAIPSSFLAEAPINDLRTAEVLVALQEFLAERRCEPDFVLVFNE